MPLEKIRFKIGGDTEYSRAFEMFATEAADMSPALEDIGDSLILAVGEQFATEGVYGGGDKWEPLDRDYAAWKDEEFPGRPMLVLTGEMRAAALDKKRALTVTPKKLTYEIHDDKAIYHQRGNADLPQRKLVELPTSERRQWDRFVVAWLNDIRRGPIGRSRS